MYYAVIDTNVFISALITKNREAATVLILDRIMNGDIVPVFFIYADGRVYGGSVTKEIRIEEGDT